MNEVICLDPPTRCIFALKTDHFTFLRRIQHTSKVNFLTKRISCVQTTPEHAKRK